MHPAMLPRGKPQDLQRTIRQTGFYFQLFLSNFVHSGEISASVLCPHVSRVSFFRLRSGEDAMDAIFGVVSL